MLQEKVQHQKKKNSKWGLVVSVLVLMVSVVAMIMIGGGVPGMVERLALEVSRDPAEAVLTSANVGEGTVVSIPVSYYMQQADECVNMYDLEAREALKARQFEWAECGYYGTNIESGLVEFELNEKHLPVAVGGEDVPNRGISSESFAKWFNAVESENVAYPGALSLVYNQETTSFEFGSENFGQSAEAEFNGRNDRLFTMNFGVPLRVLKSGHEEMTIMADDDTWVFVDDKLVLDMGGVHGPVTGVFQINESGEIYAAVDGVDLAYSGVTVSNENAVVRVFHANRDSVSSVFRIRFTDMVLSIMNNAGVAVNDGGEVQLAYDPNDSSFAMPLGESLSVQPRDTKAFMVSLVIQVVAIGAFVTLAVVAISVVWRYWRRDHNQVK